VDAYEALGRLSGAISQHATALLGKLWETEGVDLNTVLPRLFHALVHVDAAGTVTRRRAFRDELNGTAHIPPIIDNLVEGRLLAAEDTDGRATITLAHEALIKEWSHLRDWLDRNRAQLQRIQSLLINLVAPKPADRRYAAEALGQLGPAAAVVMPALIDTLGDANSRVRQSAAWALEEIGPTAVSALITALGGGDMWVRRSAAAVLGRIGSVTEEVVPALITALGDGDTWVRRSAVEALGRIGPATVEVMPALIAALGDGDTWVRRSAVEALRNIEPAATEAVPALITALGDADKVIRVNAAAALGRIGPAATEAVPALITALRDDDFYVRQGATQALQQIQLASPGANSA
jgi:HEAT repeat protein